MNRLVFVLVGGYAALVSIVCLSLIAQNDELKNAVIDRNNQIGILQRQPTPNVSAYERKLTECQQTADTLRQEKNALVLASTSTPTPRSEVAALPVDTMFDACVMAQDFARQVISKKLGVAEKVVRFPWGETCEETVKMDDPGIYVYSGTVLYKNAANADMQASVVVTVQDIGNDQWKLVDLQVK